MTKVLIFAERMLPSTQTFIPLQVNELRRYEPQYVGLLPADRNLALPTPPILLSTARTRVARIRREAYRWTGIAPSFHRRLQNVHAQLLHAHFAEGAAPAVNLSRRLNLPLILHLRGGAELFPDRELRRHLFQWPYLRSRRALWARASLFICVSDYIRQKALRAGFPADKLHVHYTGMDLTLFKPGTPPVERDPNLILYVGRLVPYKGCDYLLRALALLQRQHPQARAVIIGNGTFRPELERLATELGVRAEFLGEQPQTAIRRWLEQARVFCAPSVTLSDGMSEAFGNVFSEAQAMRLPVVSFRHGGIPETMREGITGLLAEERDVETLAAHLGRLLTDDAFWANASDQAHQFVHQQFDVRTQTAKLETIYDEVIRKFRPDKFAQAAALP